MVQVPKKEDACVIASALYDLSDVSESIRKKGVGNFQGWKICETVCPFDLLTAFSLREPSSKLFISSS